ncbi:wd-40 repeat protein [Stylonychia lemnae]|uniref:Wd-40 repeat protein n=1 Tax=Stylonychia lemnae TaxID=5949 RepID=A0A078ARK0_STYLE|nr:wd-40 repeat protein [Stylonychia lemnae]|eukprot:CDW84834.1 wd-40 repeat protein [Stylonychia lemnae]
MSQIDNYTELSSNGKDNSVQLNQIEENQNLNLIEETIPAQISDEEIDLRYFGIFKEFHIQEGTKVIKLKEILFIQERDILLYQTQEVDQNNLNRSNYYLNLRQLSTKKLLNKVQTNDSGAFKNQYFQQRSVDYIYISFYKDNFRMAKLDDLLIPGFQFNSLKVFQKNFERMKCVQDKIAIMVNLKKLLIFDLYIEDFETKFPQTKDELNSLTDQMVNENYKENTLIKLKSSVDGLNVLGTYLEGPYELEPIMRDSQILILNRIKYQSQLIVYDMKTLQMQGTAQQLEKYKDNQISNVSVWDKKYTPILQLKYNFEETVLLKKVTFMDNLIFLKIAQKQIYLAKFELMKFVQINVYYYTLQLNNISFVAQSNLIGELPELDRISSNNNYSNLKKSKLRVDDKFVYSCFNLYYLTNQRRISAKELLKDIVPEVKGYHGIVENIKLGKNKFGFYHKFIYYKNNKISRTLDIYQESLNDLLFKSQNYSVLQKQYFKDAKSIKIGNDASIRFKFLDNDEDKSDGFLKINFSIMKIMEYRNIYTLQTDDVYKNLQNVNEYLYHVPGFGNCFNMFCQNILILEYLCKQIQDIQRDKLPILINKNLLNGSSPLDKVLEMSQQKNVFIILDLILKYQNHILFNEIVDKNICRMVSQSINLQDYFQSQLPIYQIFDDKYPIFHTDDSELLVGVNLDHPLECHEMYETLFAQKLDEYDDSKPLNSIEYLLINLPHTLQDDNVKIIRQLKSTELQDNLDQDMRQNYLFIINKIISAGILFYFFVFEVRQMKIQRSKYFQYLWNIIDMIHISCYIVLSIVEYHSDNSDNVVLLFVVVISFTFLKLYYFLRIFEGFSFLVQMIAKVFQDLKFFIAFFLIFIVQFGLIFTVLFKAAPIEEYDGVNAFGYYLMIFRISAGDFTTDNYKDQSQYLIILTWIVWIIAVIILNIIFMNFIIAVISESYEKVMQKIIAESYKVKVHMIKEREHFFKEKDFLNEKFFPKYIIVRRLVNSESLENANSDQVRQQIIGLEDIECRIRYKGVKN